MTSLALLHRRVRLLARAPQRIGLAGLAGLGALTFAVFAVATAPYFERGASALRAEYGNEIARRDAERRTPPVDATSRMARFRAWFPSSARAVDDLRTVFRIARQQRIDLARGDYKTARKADADLVTLDVVLPVAAGYASVRAFVAGVLNELPHASLTELRMEKTGAGDALETRVHLTFFYRED